MSRVPNKQPSLQHLQSRAALYSKIRDFFAKRGVLEVNTPSLYPSTTSDVFIKSLKVHHNKQTRYLQTSPELAMKKLLSQAKVSMYQLCKAFRDEEEGKMHNIEFTMLEWYRVNFTMMELIDEVIAFLLEIFPTYQLQKTTYTDLFQQSLAVNPITASLAELYAAANPHDAMIQDSYKLKNRNALLMYMMSNLIEPTFAQNFINVVYYYPASQALQSRIYPQNTALCERFEVYIGPVEIANGYRELTQAAAYQERFLQDNQTRQALQLEQIPLDKDLLSCIEHYQLPECSGVALGVDRLLMLKDGVTNIEEILVR